MKERKGREILSRIIGELISYTKYHFPFEEKLIKVIALF